MKLDKIYKTTSIGKVQQWEVEVEGNQYWMITGQVGGKLVTSKPTICEGKNLGRSNETSPSEQALFEATAARRKKLEQDYVESMDLLGTNETTYTEPMLAKIYGDYKEKVDYKNGIFTQPKLDGIRVITRKDGMWTRKGKPIPALPHIFDTLKPIFAKFPSLVIDGEAYSQHLKSDFEALSSIVRKLKPTPEDIENAKQMEYWVYDCILDDKNAVFSERSAFIEKHLSGIPGIVVVETHQVEAEYELDMLYEKYLEAGYEGQMIRFDTKYENKRTHNLLKRKEFIDEEFTIVDICEGIGNKSGAAGFFIVTDGVNQFNSNIKRSYDECVELLKNKEHYINQICTIRFQNKSIYNIPRFPRVIDIGRDDA